MRVINKHCIGFALAEEIKKDPTLDGVTIMMLTSVGQLGDAARCRELGISAYLVKPIREKELLEAVCRVLNKASKQESVPLVTRHTIRETKGRGRVLLAEDNPVNQTLAVRLLEKRGYQVSVAENGSEALAALEKDSFDIILMDVQMPGTDGFEATAAIRAREKSSGQHIPIVAMTAHALKGDQERCLSVGMDAYVSKPIRTNELFTTIETLIGKKNETQTNEPPTPKTPSRSPYVKELCPSSKLHLHQEVEKRMPAPFKARTRKCILEANRFHLETSLLDDHVLAHFAPAIAAGTGGVRAFLPRFGRGRFGGVPSAGSTTIRLVTNFFIP